MLKKRIVILSLLFIGCFIPGILFTLDDGNVENLMFGPLVFTFLLVAWYGGKFCWWYLLEITGISSSKNDKLLNKEVNKIYYHVEKAITKSIIDNLEYKADKICKALNNSCIAVNQENKKFSYFKTRVSNTSALKSSIERIVKSEKDITNVVISNDVMNNLVETYTAEPTEKIYDFSALLKVDVIDKTKTDTKRTFTMESNAGKAIAGAFLGEALLGGVPSATVGAIAGAAGERKIREEVETTTTIAFDIVLYLNDLNNPNITLHVDNESSLRELVGVLEFILNNK